MKIQLKNVKYAAFASEETACFEAAIWVDGKKEGHVRNDGHGGCNWIEPMSLHDRIEAYAKTLPPMKLEFGGKVHEMEHSADSYISEILEDHLQEKELKKMLKAHLVGRRPDGAIIKTRKLTPVQMEQFCKAKVPMGEPKDKVVVLNYLPFEKALAFYRGAPA